jgi:hypothetical protein
VSVDTTERPGSRLPVRLRVEDVLLFLWLVLQPLVFPAPASGSATVPGFDPIGGLFDLVGLCGAAACIAARRRDATQTGLIQGDEVAYAVGPLFGAVAFTGQDCVERLGLAGRAEQLPIVLPIAVAILARLRLPPTTAIQRRALVTPFILATSGFFGQFLAGFSDIFDVRNLLSALSGGGQLAESVFVFGLGLVAVLIFYVMLVFAPRQIAEREGTPGSWASRFLVFIAGLSIGSTLAAMVHGR